MNRLSAFLVFAALFFPAGLAAQSRDFDGQPFGLEKIGIDEIRKEAADESAGRVTGEIKYTAGPDKLWFTGDDTVYHFFAAEYDGQGGMTKKSCFKAGPDGRPWTPDDELQNIQLYGYEGGRAAGDETLNAAGALVMKSAYAYDRKGRKVSETRSDASGRVIRLIRYEYGKGDKPVRDTEYVSPGADGSWGTIDDEIEKYHRREYAGGQLTRVSECLRDRDGAGADGKWFTADDVVSSTKQFIRDESGRVAKVLKCTAAGADGQWFTGDEEMQYYTVRSYGDGGNG